MPSKTMIRVSTGVLDASAEARSFSESHLGSGAIVTFTGHVRGDGGVMTLTLEHYPGFTEAAMTEMAKTAAARWALDGLIVVHRVGVLAPGEAIVFVAAAAMHRRTAFEAVDFMMDYLKSAAPLWKKETSAAGEWWIEPRAEDYADMKRWGRS